MHNPNEFQILILEDDVTQLLSMQEILEEIGYKVLPSTDYTEAKKIFLINNPSLGILDIGIGRKGPKKGITFGKEIKSRNRNYPLIYVSGRLDHNNNRADTINSVSPEIILSKPYSSLDLVNAVELCLKKSYPEGLLKELGSGPNVKFYSNRLVLREKDVWFNLNHDEIMYLQASGNHTIIRVEDPRDNFIDHEKEIIIKSTNLKNFLEGLPSNRFVRVHNSYGVNVDRIKGYNKKEIELSDGTRIKLSNKDGFIALW